jgi:DNA-binding SARP family transcriptional activator/tetratricopeptide (TPR) repeat protein
MELQFRLLGPLETRASDGRLVQLRAEKHRVVLAALLLSANRWLETDRLVEALWADRPPRSAASALRTYVSDLRRLLRLSTETLVARRGAYQIRVASDDLDLAVFEEVAAGGLKALADGDPSTAASRLHRAMALWRGRALEDVPLEADFDGELSRLEELRLTVLEAWIEARLALGQHADVVAELRAPVAAQPLRERLQGLWLTALYRCGQQAEALAAYRSLRERLVAELGIEPSLPLQRLHRQMLSADPGLQPPQPPPAAAVPRHLPADIAWFTGREQELAWLSSLWHPERHGAAPVLAAIDGVAGVGKSALAVHAAHRLAEHFPDGTLYADLAGVAGAPVPTLAVLVGFLRALGTPDGDVASLDEAAARFRALTAARRLLVVLDNARDAAQVQPLLPAGPGCVVLCTSRRVLSTLDGVYPLHLEVLPPEHAVQLIARVTGASRVAADRPAAEEVARLCGYLPLALRIAGARLAARPSWPVRALRDRLAGAQRRLDELQVGDLGVRASFQVSLDALAGGADPRDRLAARAFPLLGLPAGADLGVAAAARLVDLPEPDAEAALERLVDAQLLDSPRPGRYRLHDLLRLFAGERAAEQFPPGERTDALMRLFGWYCSTAWGTLRLLRPGHQRRAPAGPPGLAFESAGAALEWLEAERDNLISAIDQAPATAPGIAQALMGYFQVRGYWHDWIRVNRTVLALTERTGDLRAAAYARRDIGVAHDLLGDYDQALASLTAGLDLFRRVGDLGGQAESLTSLGIVHHRLGRYPQALDCHRESLAIRRTTGDERGQAINLSNLGVTYQRTGDAAAAHACFQDCLAFFERTADRPSTGTILTNIGTVYESQGRYADAVDCHERSLEIFRELGDPGAQGEVLNNLGGAYRQLGRYDRALACQREGLTLTERLGDRFSRAECLRELGATWHAMGDERQARVAWTDAMELFRELGVPEAAEVKDLLEGNPDRDGER